MNSSAPSTTSQARSSVRARLASNWIEIFIIPIASAIMETQPILLGFQFLVSHAFGLEGQVPAATIVLLLLGFHWWAMWSNSSFGWFRTTGEAPRMPLVLSNLFAFLLALGLLILTNLALLNDIELLILLLILMSWAWKRGQIYVQADMDEERLLLAFKIGFIALLVILFFALLDLLGDITALNDALLRDLPIFFLSGVLTLSFSRLNTFKKEQARNPISSRKTGFNTWAIVMTMTWIALVALGIALEGLSPSALQTLGSPLWYLLGLLASLILAVLEFIAHLFLAGLQTSLPSVPILQQSGEPVLRSLQYASNQAMYLQTILEIILIVLLLLGLLLLLLLIFKSRKRVITTDEKEEIREDLDREAILKERRAERKARQKSFTLEPLEPLSARALYREFLIAMAEQGEQLQRGANETPGEYKKRLLALATHLPAVEDQSAPPDLEILDELTQAYTRERYGAQLLTSKGQGYLRQWVPVLAQRFARLSKRSGA